MTRTLQKLTGRASRAAAVGAVGIIALIGPIGCTESGTGPGGNARVEGRVAGDDGYAKSAAQAVEGAATALARIEADGSLEGISTSTMTTGADGEFALETSLADARYVVVVATKDALEWKAVVSGALRAGATVKSQPLNDETTVEADVYARVVAHGETDEVTFADVASHVDATVAAEVKGNATAVEALALAIETEAKARADFLTDASVGLTPARLDAIASARVEAQAALETALDAASGSEAAIDAAFEEFFRAAAEAYVAAEVAPETGAQAEEVGARALLEASASLDAGARLAIERTAARLRAATLSAVIRAQLAALGASSIQLEAVAQSGAALVTAIRASGSADALIDAFEAYHDAVLLQLQTVAIAHATAIASIDAEINQVGGARMELELAVATAATTQDVLNAYLEFFAAVRAQAEEELSGASSGEIAAIAEALIAINMAF